MSERIGAMEPAPLLPPAVLAAVAALQPQEALHRVLALAALVVLVVTAPAPALAAPAVERAPAPTAALHLAPVRAVRARVQALRQVLALAPLRLLAHQLDRSVRSVLVLVPVPALALALAQVLALLLAAPALAAPVVLVAPLSLTTAQASAQ